MDTDSVAKALDILMRIVMAEALRAAIWSGFALVVGSILLVGGRLLRRSKHP